MRAKPRSLHRREFLALGGSAFLLGLAPAYARGAAPVTSITGEAFGTGWRVALPAGADLPSLRAGLIALLDGIDLAFSPWRADSVIGRFNRSPAEAMPVTREIEEVTRAALHIAEASGGRFDPTVGPLVARWGFGPIREGEAPADGWRGIAMDGGHIVRKERGITLDLCGIAKGHALDRMVGLLLDVGQENFLVDLGGELAARGRHPSGRPWRVAIEDPRPGIEAAAEVVSLGTMAVATSGDRINAYDVGSRRYSHIIDPATREPVAGAPASVSVLMANGREADGWATALMAAGPDGPALARRLGLPALFLFRDGDGLRRVATGTFTQHLA